jgi:hypothetical protein
MLGIEYLSAAVGVIMHLQTWIVANDPGRVEPLSWPEVTSNLDHLADDEGNTDAVRMMIADYFQDEPTKALRVAQCESGFNPKATNGYYKGVFQIGGGSLIARENIEHAKRIRDNRGWQPWECQ